ncbi:MAG TPA: M20/M25/M40 family metallo-hydrolase [Kofleriaceae bacterium]|nr:M20/M25/M40 family metallo-hydrolase [Kofleriaceae bacterium]
MIRAFLVVPLGILGVSCAGSPQPRGAGSAASPFDVAQLRADIRFLASDLLEGRRAGTRGYDIAAEYVASRLASLGIGPGGDGGYLQPVRLREVTPDVDAIRVELSDPALAAAVRVPDSALVNADFAHLELDLAGRMTYAGKGVCDPDSGRDDAAGADLTGRFAVVLAGVAAGLPPARAGVRSDTASKWACVSRRGAIGMVMLRTAKATTLRWASTVASYRSGAMGLVDADAARSRSVPAPIVVLDAPAARAALAAAGRELDAEEARAQAGKIEHFDLPGTLAIHYRGHARDLASSNVVGRIDGADPALAREAVVVSAHLDHLGVDASGGIRNGAIDNASGIAQLLQIARALAAQPRPRRTVILLATTGEELGLLGAEAYVAHPTWPVDRIVADINIDQTGMMWPIVDVVADGAERSTLAAPVAHATAALGLAVSPDPVPEQGFFLRSDQAPFARAGVPSMIFRPGFRDATGGTDGNRALFTKWRSTAYHSPLDKIDQRDPPIDFDSGVTMAHLVYLTALEVANADARPRWNPGDVFAPGPAAAPRAAMAHSRGPNAEAVRPGLAGRTR